jgi:hypothetical protein
MRAAGRRTLADVESWLEHRVFALEHETARAFRQAGFSASLGRAYVDSTEHKPREIDVVAEVQLTQSPARIYAVVECKAATLGAWVIRQAELGWNDDLWSLLSTPDLSSRLEPLAHVVASALPLGRIGEPTPFAIVEAVDRADRDGAFWAVSQAVSAARGWLQRATVPSIAFPLIVVDTPLFTLRYDRMGNPELTQVEWSRLLWPSPGPKAQTAVEIIARSSLAQRALDLRHDLGWLAEKLVQAGLPPAQS